MGSGSEHGLFSRTGSCRFGLNVNISVETRGCWTEQLLGIELRIFIHCMIPNPMPVALLRDGEVGGVSNVSSIGEV